jgi:hypothetical protein
MKLSKSDKVWGALMLVIGISAYYAYRNKQLKTEDLQKTKDVTPVNPVDTIGKRKLGLSDLNFTGKNVKNDLIIKPRNLIPNVYDRGIGDEVNFYGNMTESTVNISSACKYADKKKKLPIGLPKING